MNINCMELKEKIYDEIKRLNIRANGIWTGNNFLNGFKCYLNISEIEKLENTINELICDGIFENTIKGCMLTQKGEDIIYHNT